VEGLGKVACADLGKLMRLYLVPPSFEMSRSRLNYWCDGIQWNEKRASVILDCVPDYIFVASVFSELGIGHKTFMGRTFLVN
jgi:hypothetical protein